MIKHTPGPWKGGQYLGSLTSFHVHMDVGDRGRGANVVDGVCGLDIEERLANAQLIAAAPELLEVLVEITETLGNMNTFSKARAAIAKALGES
jgi:hypothetical protein